MKIRTHYDNLKVSRDAPAEVIRAAYKSLSQKYHPDRNPGDIQAEKIMRLINQAYEVLSDPERREQHDKWIQAEEWNAANKVGNEEPREQPSKTNTKTTQTPTEPKKMPKWLWALLSIVLLPINIALYVVRHLLFFALLGFLGWVIYTIIDDYRSKPEITLSPEENRKVLEQVERNAKETAASRAAANASTGQKNQAQAPAICSPAMTKAPNGNAWPSSAAYVAPITRKNGYSSVTVDNSQGQSNIYIKLSQPNEGKAPGIREAYIPAGKAFKMNKIEPGTYVIKYKDIKTGCNSKSDPFNVEENKTYQGVEFSEITLTIYTTYNGNMNFERLPENAF